VTETDRSIGPFADYVALAYHEARNVRHLIAARHLDPDIYPHLVNLPRDRDEAWRALQGLRAEAKQARSARAVETVFQLSLEDLSSLFDNPNWRHSMRGGNQWAHITRALIELRNAIDAGEQGAICALLERIRQMRHNTGIVGLKLRDLDRTFEQAT
jgi:hypothetical protein